MTADVELLPCGQCGMPCRAGEYHPFAACLMFKACHNSETVRANLATPQAEIEKLRSEVELWRHKAAVHQYRRKRLEEALRELVGVFSESGMYDDEVFDNARDALAEEDE